MNRYSVVLLGTRGAGKTVFLGSMFHRLSVAGQQGFFLDAEGRQRRRLNEVYRTIAAGQEWPDATMTGDLSLYNFTCRVVSPVGKIYPAFEMTYYDYGGGRLTEEAFEGDAEFEEVLTNADCLLALLDGQRIDQFIMGTDTSGRFEFGDISSLIPILTRSEHPVHLVISKWDLIHDKYTLEQIREHLLQIEQIRSLVATRARTGSPVRLIPVSSVGAGFARPDTAGMRKTGGPLRPFQVEVPFALVLLDKVEAELERAIREQERIGSERPPEIKPNLTAFDRLGEFFGGTMRVVREVLPSKFQFTEALIRRIADASERSARVKRASAKDAMEAAQRRIDASLEKVRDEQSALAHTVETFIEIRRKFDYDFPASRVDLPKHGP